MGLAIIDFEPFLNGPISRQEAVAARLVESLSSCGFAKLINHGIPLEVIDKAHHWNKSFFYQSSEVKAEAISIPGPWPQRGWSYKGAETTAGLRSHTNAPKGKFTDEKENFDLGPKDDKEFPNKWTETTLPGFREFSETKLYDLCQNLCLQIMRAFELAYNLPVGMLTERCSPPASEIRYNYYPAVAVKRLSSGSTQRGWPHTDFGLITLVFQDTQGGLEYEDRGKLGTFLPLVRKTDDEIAVNISDTFQRWSNNLFLAGVHQVVTPRHLVSKEEHVEDLIIPERFSTVFFFKASRESMVGSLPPFVSDKAPAVYEDISALEFQKKMTMILVQSNEDGEK